MTLAYWPAHMKTSSRARSLPKRAIRLHLSGSNRDTTSKLRQSVTILYQLSGVTEKNAQLGNLAGQLGARISCDHPGVKTIPSYHTAAVFLVTRGVYACSAPLMRRA